MTAVGRRISKAIDEFESKDYESCALHLFSAAEATARKRFGKKSKNGERFRGLIEQQEDIITAWGFNNIHIGTQYNGKTLPEALWTFARNPLSHEGEFEKRINFNLPEGLIVGSKWSMSPKLLFGLVVGVVSAKENEGEEVPIPGEISFFGSVFIFQDVWGKEEVLRGVLRKHFPFFQR